MADCEALDASYETTVGLPVVATSIAAEGMSLVNGENIRFADSQWRADAAWKLLAEILAGMEISVKRDDRPLKLYAAKGR